MSMVSPNCYQVNAAAAMAAAHQYNLSQQHTVLPPPRSYYVVSWVPRALPEVVQLVKEIPNDAEKCLINKHFELGMLVMRRCGVQNPEDIKCLLDGFREGSTRLSLKERTTTGSDDNKSIDQDTNRSYCTEVNPAVERRKLLIFFNDHRASRPWVLCPAKHCIKSARTTGKVKGRVKIFQFEPKSSSVCIPKLFFNTLNEFMTRDQYVFATFCPQQKYTDHELSWFDTGPDRLETGGDRIFRDLVDEHDAKGSRLWPFEDYIIFANSQSKIVAVFKKKQPLLTLYRQGPWPMGLNQDEDNATVTTTASSMMVGTFLLPHGTMTTSTSGDGSCILSTTSGQAGPSSHAVTTTTTTTGSCGFERSAGIEDECGDGHCYTVIDAATGGAVDNPSSSSSSQYVEQQQHHAPHHHYHNMGADNGCQQQPRQMRQCRKSRRSSFLTAESFNEDERNCDLEDENIGRDGGENHDDDGNDGDSDFDLSKRRYTSGSRHCYERKRRGSHHKRRHHSYHRDDLGGNHSNLPLPPSIVSPSESHHLHHHPATTGTAAAQQSSPFDYYFHQQPQQQFGFTQGVESSGDLIRQAEGAETVLISIMTRVLSQLEPYEQQLQLKKNSIGSDSGIPMKMEKSETDQPQQSTTTSSCCGCPEEQQNTTTAATTTTAGSSELDEKGNRQSESGIQASAPPSKRRLDLAALGQDLDHKRRKVIHYASPMNAVLYHQLVRQFLSQLAFGLDHPPIPQKRIPDTVKRVVTKIVADSIKDINLALITSAIRSSTTTDGGVSSPQGQTSSVESIYSQPFSGFCCSQPPPGNNAIVMSSRAGIYSTTSTGFDDRTTSDQGSSSPFASAVPGMTHHHHPLHVYSTAAMGGMTASSPEASAEMFSGHPHASSLSCMYANHPFHQGMDPTSIAAAMSMQHQQEQQSRNPMHHQPHHGMMNTIMSGITMGMITTPHQLHQQLQHQAHQQHQQLENPEKCSSASYNARNSGIDNALCSGFSRTEDSSEEAQGQVQQQQINNRIPEQKVPSPIVKHSAGEEGQEMATVAASEQCQTFYIKEDPTTMIGGNQQNDNNNNNNNSELPTKKLQTRTRQRTRAAAEIMQSENNSNSTTTRSTRRRKN